MLLKIVSTEYNFDCLGNEIKAVLGFHDGKASLDLFINNHLSYYYIIKDFKTLTMDDLDLIELAAMKIYEDKERWLRDCSIIKDHFNDFKLINKGSMFTFDTNGIIFFIKISIEEKDDKYLFRLEYTNSKNNDILDCMVEANDYKELLKKSMMYAGTITEISKIFSDNHEQLLNNAFSKHFEKQKKL